jgi:5-methylthioadenosine/S-adenosylhomocysteine deaminase
MTGFCPGYIIEPFKTLAVNYPDETVYPSSDFRTEWGPIFHRGRLDSSAHLLIIGQDPAASETIVRRILVGAAGHRVQGFMKHLGLTRSYVLVNTFLYSIYGQGGGNRHATDPKIAAYRERWFDALFTSNIEAVLALGGLAETAWSLYANRVKNHATTITFVHMRHPTWPESSSNGNPQTLAANTAELLKDWNRALDILYPAIQHRDTQVTLKRYGTKWQNGDLASIPPEDLPAGLPAWMRAPESWAKRVGSSPSEKRATLQVKVPDSYIKSLLTVPPAAAMIKPVVEPRHLPDDSYPIRTNEYEAIAFAMHPESRTKGTAVVAKALRQYALRGRLVTMSANGVIKDGILWIDKGKMAAITVANDPTPDGFSEIPVIDTGATIYPGFMDLHNHLAYNILSLWSAAGSYDNRDDWKDEATYDQMIKRPLSILRGIPNFLSSICRYAECKALFGGTTTSQGIRLAKANQAPSYFRGIVRNVESPDDQTLPRGESRMSDVIANDLKAFWKNLQAYDQRGAAFLLHLAEGYDTKAHEHFEILKLNGNWAIDRALAGIHCVALNANDFQTLKINSGSIIWSPMSNLLLYGKTADIPSAKAARLRIALGCDWSPSGSKNLLSEMKVAWLYAKDYKRRTRKKLFSAEDIVAMVTRVSAEILRWDQCLGTIETGKLADLTILSNCMEDAYENAIHARESDVKLVVVGGVPRYGDSDLMHELVSEDRDVEDVLIMGEPRTIDLESDDERVPRIAFTKAQALLTDALRRLPELEKAQKVGMLHPAMKALPNGSGWTLALDEIEPTGVSLRLNAAAIRPANRPSPTHPVAALKLPTIPVSLDPPTIVNDAGYFGVIDSERNLPAYIKSGLRRLYSATASRPRKHKKVIKKPAKPTVTRTSAHRGKTSRNPSSKRPKHRGR